MMVFERCMGFIIVAELVYLDLVSFLTLIKEVDLFSSFQSVIEFDLASSF